MVRPWTNPCSAIRPRIRPSTIGEGSYPNRFSTHPKVPRMTMTAMSAMLFLIAKVPIKVMKATLGTSNTLGTATISL